MRKIIVILLNSFFVCNCLNAQEIKRIDTHIHLYDTNRSGSFDFLNDHQSVGSVKLRFPHLAKQFSDSAKSVGVRFAYVVEASTRREDNFWLSEICDSSACILGFSTNLNPLDETFIEDLESLSKNPKFRGVRPRIRGFDLSDAETIKRLGELEKRGLVLELWGNNSAIATIASLYPNMNIIVNHFAGGAIHADGIPNKSAYISKLEHLAAQSNVYIKISALYTRSGKRFAPINMEYYKPLIDAAVDAFGPERVMFGSNWPLSGLRGNYRSMTKLLDEYCKQREDLSAEQLFYNNAIKAYGL